MIIRSILLVAVVWTSTGTAFAQEQLTTFILIRHGERAEDGSEDPELSDEGKSRATRLAEMLSKTSIQAVYSTSFKRTRNTVSPLAQAKGLEVLLYEPLKADPLDKMLKDHVGGTVVISGHSNTIPWTANYLIGKEQLKNFAADDYKNFLVVTVLKKGSVTNITWLTY